MFSGRPSGRPATVCLLTPGSQRHNFPFSLPQCTAIFAISMCVYIVSLDRYSDDKSDVRHVTTHSRCILAKPHESA